MISASYRGLPPARGCGSLWACRRLNRLKRRCWLCRWSSGCCPRSRCWVPCPPGRGMVGGGRNGGSRTARARDRKRASAAGERSGILAASGSPPKTVSIEYHPAVEEDVAAAESRLVHLPTKHPFNKARHKLDLRARSFGGRGLFHRLCARLRALVCARLDRQARQRHWAGTA